MAKTRKTKKTPKYVTRPTVVAIVSGGSRPGPRVVVGSRRIATTEKAGGKVLDSKKLYWSQIKHAKVAKAKGGKLLLSTEREAAAKGYEVVG